MVRKFREGAQTCFRNAFPVFLGTVNHEIGSFVVETLHRWMAFVPKLKDNKGVCCRTFEWKQLRERSIQQAMLRIEWSSPIKMLFVRGNALGLPRLVMLARAFRATLDCPDGRAPLTRVHECFGFLPHVFERFPRGLGLSIPSSTRRKQPQ